MLMSSTGWHQLIPSAPVFRGAGLCPIDAYSEFMPPPRCGWKPYAAEPPEAAIFNPDDPLGWYIGEYEEAHELQPGLDQVAAQLIQKLRQMLRGDSAHGISQRLLDGNVYWPDELRSRAGALHHDACVTLAPLALSRTQDDKGRVRWTLFGGSEQGPGRAFWKSFEDGAHHANLDPGPRFLATLLRTVFHIDLPSHDELLAAGFRILPQGPADLDFQKETLPDWTRPFVIDDAAAMDEVKYLLTFRPFGLLPESVRRAYLECRLHLLPTPASLVFWGVPRILHLRRELPLGLQIPLLINTSPHNAPHGLRVPQSGLLHEHVADRNEPVHPELVRNTYRRTNRWDRVPRDLDELQHLRREDPLIKVLFSSLADDLQLYDKPMARNVQLWTPDGQLILDGPSATPEQIQQAMHTVRAGGVFGYRFVWPALRVGVHEIYWHRPLVAYQCAETDKPALVPEAPLGYLTGYAAPPLAGASLPADPAYPARSQYRVTHEALTCPVELWPRLHRRPLPTASLTLYQMPGDGPMIARNVRNLFDAYQARGNRLVPCRMARELIALPHDQKLKDWIEALPTANVYDGMTAILEPKETPLARRAGARTPEALTYATTTRRSFETAYWKMIALLAEGRYLNKNNADCVRDAVTQSLLPYPGRHLDALGDFLLDYYRQKIAAAGLSGQAFAGEQRFQWRTDFDLSWMEGWLANQEKPSERNLITAIPGKDRSRAVLMADHYDTAYMADRYASASNGKGARIAACGADDNASATAALALAAPIFLEMSKQGRLGCDIWIVHLTGAEFPADSLGARHLVQALVESQLVLHGGDGVAHDMSGVQVKGVYVADMIAHNNHRERDVFQIAPGTGWASFQLAEWAHEANAVWNASVPVWNRRVERVGKTRGRRSPYGNALPDIAAHLALHGQIRTVADPRSTLFNSDAQVFSDAGVPVVLIRENFDIRRTGYHDSLDTMANIDLDYGAALAAMVIETVARAAGGTEIELQLPQSMP